MPITKRFLTELYIGAEELHWSFATKHGKYQIVRCMHEPENYDRNFIRPQNSTEARTTSSVRRVDISAYCGSGSTVLSSFGPLSH